MKIAIASDFHFGYAWDGERKDDSFIQGEEAIKCCLGADAIILPGDIFDSRIPKQEVMDKAMRIIGLASARPSAAKIERDGTMPGTPVIAIHGTHERRAQGLTNPVQLLEAAGLCIALHNNAIVLSKGGERVAIHGMGGVPEQYAPLALKECNFRPLVGMVNILVLHQSFREYIYEDAAFLSMADLPPGFDLYINGHVHLSDVKEQNGKVLLHPGSTVLTQLRKAEAGQPKRVWFYDTSTKKLASRDLESPRKAYYLELEASGPPQRIIADARKLLSGIHASPKPPLVKLKITGSLPAGASLDINEITRGYDMIVSVDSALEAKQFKRKIELLRDSQSRKSVDELGLAILEKNLGQAGYDGPSASELLPLLSEGKEGEARKLISGSRSPS